MPLKSVIIVASEDVFLLTLVYQVIKLFAVSEDDDSHRN